ncbi:MAG: DUF4160 domain-containing protein [Burkholderiales bacterium]|nr:DUF4160 domain-containing protein [Burkholderiales bacterium]
MPTILLIDGLRVTVYPNDHQPAHVHVIGKGCEVIFKLNCPEGPPELRENYGFPKKELVRIQANLAVNLAMLCEKWSDIHDDYR